MNKCAVFIRLFDHNVLYKSLFPHHWISSYSSSFTVFQYVISNLMLLISMNLPKVINGLFSSSVSVSQYTWVRLVSKLATPAGSFTAWNMASSLMDRCPATRPLEEEMILSTPSSVRLELESMSPELFLWTWSPLSLVNS